MSTYILGDVQGCYEPMRRLLDTAGFDPSHDQLWVVGDLVNRGPQSLATLHYLKGLGKSAVSLLGNHDISLLVVAEGFSKQHRGDTMDDILDAPDREELLAWLRHQKLMHVEGNAAMVHAGLLPQWSIAKAAELAHEVEQTLRSDDYREFLRVMYGNQPDHWDDNLRGYERLRVVVNAMTRMRLCSHDGVMEYKYKLAPNPQDMPKGFLPWYDVPDAAWRAPQSTVFFGHWASLGLMIRSDVVALDSGCVWGRQLTLMRLEDGRVFDCGCPGIKGAEPD